MKRAFQSSGILVYKTDTNEKVGIQKGYQDTNEGKGDYEKQQTLSHQYSIESKKESDDVKHS